MKEMEKRAKSAEFFRRALPTRDLKGVPRRHSSGFSIRKSSPALGTESKKLDFLSGKVYY